MAKLDGLFFVWLVASEGKFNILGQGRVVSEVSSGNWLAQVESPPPRHARVIAMEQIKDMAFFATLEDYVAFLNSLQPPAQPEAVQAAPTEQEQAKEGVSPKRVKKARKPKETLDNEKQNVEDFMS